MARKKEVVIKNAEVVDAEPEEVKEVEKVDEEAPAEKTQLDYIMDVLNENRENLVQSCIWNGIEINIKRTLNIYEMKVLFEAILSRCFSTDNGSYQPEYRDFAERTAVLAIYTDINLPEDIGDQFDLVFKTDIYKFVTENVDSEQLWSIMDSAGMKIEEMIKYRSEDMLKKAQEAIDSVNDLTEQFGKLFDGVDVSDLTNVINAISEHGIDEKAIVDSVIKEMNNE